MKVAIATSLVCLSFTALCAAGTPNDPARMLATAPLRFEPAAVDGRFSASGLRHQFTFEQASATLHAGGGTVTLRFVGASPSARLQGVEKQRSTTNVFRGNDPSNWRTAVPNYSRLRASGLYPGVDLVYYGNAGELEYDLVVKPGAGVHQIRMRFDGAEPRIDGNGNLAAGFIQKKPLAYQLNDDGARVAVDCRYRRNSDGTFGLALGRYDRSHDLVIDPTLTLSVYLSGSQQDVATSIGHDSLGFIYVAGNTYSSDFITAGNAPQTAKTGTSDIFVAQIDPHATPGSQVVMSTYLGGNSTSTVNAMAVSPKGLLYLTGSTNSGDFPTANPQQSALSTGTNDAFVMLLDPSQSGKSMIVFSTFLGGTGDDFGNAIAVDSTGRIFVAGTTRSKDFPMAAAFQSTAGSSATAFVSGLDPSKSSLFFSSYLGGSGGDNARGIAAAKDGTVWVVGGTYSNGDFPITGSAYQASYRGVGDAYVAQIDPNAGKLLYTTFLGGSQTDAAHSVAIDSAGQIVVSGYTGSPDFPVTSNASQTNYGGNFDAFLTVLNPRNAGSAQVVYSTFIGGNQPDIPFDMKIDSAGNIYLSGFTMSPNFPVTSNALQSVYSQTIDGFVVAINPARAINYGSYISSDGLQSANGVDYGDNGSIYVTGYTSGPIFNGIVGGAGKPSDGGNTDAFVLGVNPCSYGLSLYSNQFSAQGGSVNVGVTASPATCSWTASSPVNWITLAPQSGTGNGTVTVTVAANTTGAPRQQNVTIAGIQFLVGESQ